MNNSEYKTLEELEDKYIGVRGTESREEYEFTLTMEIIGEKIKQLRLDRNLSKDDLSRMSGIQKALISKLEKGYGNTSIFVINKVFNALDAQIKFQIENFNRKWI